MSDQGWARESREKDNGQPVSHNMGTFLTEKLLLKSHGKKAAECA